MDPDADRPVLNYAVPDALGAPRKARNAEAYEEIEIEDESAEATTLRHASEDIVVPNVVMAISTGVFVLFAIAILPILNVSGVGRVTWIVAGFVVLACIGLAMQVRTRVTTIRIDNSGLTIHQGTLLDREHVSIIWKEIAKIELEPVDAADATKGMELRITPRAGDAVHLLPDIAVGDLTQLRQSMLERRKSAQAAKKAATKDATDAVAVPGKAIASAPDAGREA